MGIYNFLVVKSLITSAILGTDFLQKRKIVLDFSTMPVTVTHMQDKAQARVPAVPSLDQDSQKFSALWESPIGGGIKEKVVPSCRNRHGRDKKRGDDRRLCSPTLWGKGGL